MDDKSLYATLLGLTPPWGVEKVELRLEEGEVHVWVALPPKQQWACPDCQERAPIHDHRDRVWRHLDTFQYRTMLHARVPRLDCPTHGIRQLRVPWAEDNSRFTALFEAVAIDWMRQAPIAAVAERLHLSWDEAAGIQERAVRRGLARRRLEPVPFLGIDETSFQRRHEYVTLVTDLARPRVLYVADDRSKGSLEGFWNRLSPAQLAAIEGIAMDMWPPYIDSTKAHVPDAAKKIVFDKYHVASHLNHAVDLVRRAENRVLTVEGSDLLKGTKDDWLRHPNRFSPAGWRRFSRLLRRSDLKTGRAWALKEHFMHIYGLRYLRVIRRHFGAWYLWARRSRLEPMKKVADTIARHWTGICNYFRLRITNAGAEAINSRIQRLKAMARGYRNRTRFRNAILFHLGDLDLYPRPAEVSR